MSDIMPDRRDAVAIPEGRAAKPRPREWAKVGEVWYPGHDDQWYWMVRGGPDGLAILDVGTGDTHDEAHAQMTAAMA